MTTEEFNRCVDEFGPRLLQFAMRQINDIDMAKDLVQESFIVLMNKLLHVDSTKAKPFLFAVVSNKIKDYFKLKKNNTEIMPYHKTASNTAVQFESKQLVNMALAKLPLREKELIVLRDLEGYSYDEIARFTELNLAQVKVYLFRARKMFKEEVVKMEVYYE
jgi:RNA polymerase sigma factor (sigma-70 family)